MQKKILITAGGTKENIDPVRYIGNYSSGKMGIAVADEAFKNGFDVTLVTTVNIQREYKIINVQTADEMYNAVKKEFINSDYLIMAAAVADFKPNKTALQKIKKEDKDILMIELVRTPDILKEMGKLKTENQKIIGFCAESENLIENATKKIASKNLDFIVANDISRKDIGFGSDYNEITIIDKNNNQIAIPKATKQEIAQQILKYCL